MLFRSQRKLALKKLDSTNIDMERIKDILNEVETKLKNLRLQLKKFDKHKKMTQELESKQILLAKLKIDEIEVKRHPLEQNLKLDRFSLPMPGKHNISNALAAIAIACHLNIDFVLIKRSLSEFKGVNRRFTQVAEINGIKIIDDYGHHPVEISAVLNAARQTSNGKVFAIHQPHRYTRLNSLFEDFCSCFNEADFVGIMEVYSAGEDPIEGASRSDLVKGLVRHGHRNVFSIDTEDDLETLIRRQATSGDIIVCLGAGTISVWANNLPTKLSDLENL